jgi:hypothetical protein
MGVAVPPTIRGETAFIGGDSTLVEAIKKATNALTNFIQTLCL